MVHFNKKKLISYCAIFETNKYIDRSDCLHMAVDCQSDSRQRKVYRLQISKGQKAKTAMAHKNKTQKYPVDTTYNNVTCLLLWLKPRLEKDVISAGPK